MANISHSTLTDPYLHEPKGVATATSGEVYVATGAGSGVWKPADSHIDGYISYDATTPAYSHSTTTSDTPLNPTFVISTSKNFSGISSPNARLVYSGSDAVYGSINFSASMRQASGTSKDVQISIVKNGVELTGTRNITTIASGSWNNISISTISTISTSDYFEVFIKADGAHTTLFATAQLTISCYPG